MKVDHPLDSHVHQCRGINSDPIRECRNLTMTRCAWCKEPWCPDHLDSHRCKEGQKARDAEERELARQGENRADRVVRYQRHVAALTLVIESLEQIMHGEDLAYNEEWHDEVDDAHGAASDARNSLLAEIRRLES